MQKSKVLIKSNLFCLQKIFVKMFCQIMGIICFYAFVLPLFQGLYLASILILANFKHMKSMANSLSGASSYFGSSAGFSQESYFRLLIASGSINGALLIVHLIHVIGYRSKCWDKKFEVSRFDYALFLTGFPGALLSAISIMNNGISSYDEIAYYLQYANIMIAMMQKMYDSLQKIIQDLKRKRRVNPNLSTHQMTNDA